MPSSKALSIKSTHAALNFSLQLRRSLTLDFPFFEDRCELSPTTLCDHPEECRHKKTGLVGYAKYSSNHHPTHEFVPIPFDPQPIFKFLCLGCGETKGNCQEGCKTFCNELSGYKVCYWDDRSSAFKQDTITVAGYKPEKHGYFSYRVWKDNQRKEREERKARQEQRRK